MKTIAVYPGSFDPISKGHLDIITRSADLFDELYVLVSANANKTYMFNADERVEMIKKSIPFYRKNIVVLKWNDLVTSFAQKVGAKVIIRGLRNIYDYQNEITLFQYNRTINKNIETILMFPTIDNLFISSSAIKELISYGADISSYLPNSIVDDVIKKLKNNN